MKQTLYFVGRVTVVGNLQYERLGDKLEVEADQVNTIIAGGGPFLTEAQWNKVGFTEEELRRYAVPGARLNAPPAFHAKLASSIDMFRESCNSLRAAADEPVATTAPIAPLAIPPVGKAAPFQTEEDAQ